MRKWFSILLAIVIVFIPHISLAAHSPLALKGKNAYVPEENEIELISYNVFFRVRTGFSSANTSMVLKNPNLEEATTIQMGMPVQMNKVSKVRDPSVISDGKPLKVIQRVTPKNPPTTKDTDIKTWYTWEVSFEPGESKVVECSFALDNKLDLDGTEIISFPLGILSNWAGTVKSIQIVGDLDFYGPYAFDPMPSITPTDYENGGRLTFKLDKPHSIPESFDLPFKPMDVIITKYIEANGETDDRIKTIIETYKNKSYHRTITLIHDYLSEVEDSQVKVELKYLEALAYQNLYEMDKALNLFNQLEPDPGFGDSLSSTIKEKIIYDKYLILKSQEDGKEKSLEYLNSVKDASAKEDIFTLWLEKEIAILTPPVVIEEPPKTEDETPPEEDDTKVTNDETKVLDKITIKGHDFYIEEILLAAVVLFVFLFIIIKIINRKRRKRRSSIFRY